MTTRAWVNRAALAEHLRTSPQANRVLDEVVAEFQAGAEAEAPVSSGYYQDRFRIRKLALGRRLMNVDPFAHLIEWGSVNNMVYAPMRRAARKLGFRVVEAPK